MSAYKASSRAGAVGDTLLSLLLFMFFTWFWYITFDHVPGGSSEATNLYCKHMFDSTQVVIRAHFLCARYGTTVSNTRSVFCACCIRIEPLFLTNGIGTLSSARPEHSCVRLYEVCGPT